MTSVGSRAPALTILSHPDVSRVGERAILWDGDRDDGQALLARRDLDFRPPDGGEARPLADPYLSRRPIRLKAARFGGVRIDCSRTGTRVIAAGDWLSDDRVFLGVEVERGMVLVLSERLSLVLHNVDSQVADDVPELGLIGASSAMLRLQREIRQLTDRSSPVLLRGEAGTGKKSLARTLHDQAAGERPYQAVRLAEVPALGSVSDLLGRARGGTLVLDAVDRIDAELQAELLRELTAEQADVRLLATAAAEPSSRSVPGPLVDELDWHILNVPSLVQRKEDLGRLVFHFLRQELREVDALHRLADPGPYALPWMPVRLVADLASYDWPENVRQLRRVARRLAREYRHHHQVEADVDLESLLLEASDREGSSTGWGASPSRSSQATPLQRPEKLTEIELLSALRKHRWQAEPAAAQLGISPEALFSLMERFFNHEPGRGRRRRGGAFG